MTSSLCTPRRQPSATTRRFAPALATAAVLLCASGVQAVPAQAAHMIAWGSPMQTPPTRTLSAPVDAAYWQQTVAPKPGQIVTVTLWGRVAGGQPTVLFQDLRPVGGGRLKVISTTQPFQLTGASAKRTFRPVNFFVHKGDHVALATIGGSYEVFAVAPAATTSGFVGAGGDMNGSQFSGRAHSGVELLQRVSERVSG